MSGGPFEPAPADDFYGDLAAGGGGTWCGAMRRPFLMSVLSAIGGQFTGGGRLGQREKRYFGGGAERAEGWRGVVQQKRCLTLMALSCVTCYRGSI